MRTIGLTVAAFAAFALVQRSTTLAESAISGPTYVESQRVLDNFTTKKVVPLVLGDAYDVRTDKRTANGNIEIHEKETDIFYIVDGSATVIVGGTSVEPRQTRPGQMTAKDIKDGQSYNLKKGDVLVIPAGSPHWFKQVNGSISYFTVKSTKP